jgi:hypothetical protein
VTIDNQLTTDNEQLTNMKLEYTGCCFRVELELFPPGIEWQRYKVAPRVRAPLIRRKMYRQIAARMRKASQRFHE